MIPSRWSSAIAILRRRQAEAAAEERALRRTLVAEGDCDRDETESRDDPTRETDASFADRLAALWNQLTGD